MSNAAQAAWDHAIADPEHGVQDAHRGCSLTGDNEDSGPRPLSAPALGEKQRPRSLGSARAFPVEPGGALSTAKEPRV